ncbi:MAG: hypothetical protein JW828_15295 [Sedimentisphaerales bacterium]|nr:hypothetical protein [Sedimentisphaerales bacterium]
MNQKSRKLVHLLGTLWFVASAGFLLIVKMRLAGWSWWLIFSLSGHSAVLVFFLVTIYVFAVYRGVVRTQTEVEHPLTTSSYYGLFYNLAPLLGSLAGLLSSIGLPTFYQHILTMATGSLVMTFIIWIVVDPVVSITEGFTPRGRIAQKWRRGRAKLTRKRRRIASEELLNNLFQQEQQSRRRREPQLVSWADRISELLAPDRPLEKTAEAEVTEIGAKAWRLGGMAAMRQLHEMVRIQLASSEKTVVDFPAIWWDGVGDWKKPELKKCYIQPVAAQSSSSALQPSPA